MAKGSQNEDEVVQQSILDEVNAWLVKVNEFLKNTYAILTSIGLLIGYFWGFQKGKEEDSLQPMIELNKAYYTIQHLHGITDAKRDIGSQIANEIAIHSTKIEEIIKLAQNKADNDGIRVGLAYNILTDKKNCKNKDLIYRTYHKVKGDFVKYEYNKAILKLINEKCIMVADSNQIKTITYKFKVDADIDVINQGSEIKRLLHIQG